MESAGVKVADREEYSAQRQVDGQRLRVHCLHWAGPDAPVVAMVHGLEGSWDTWHPLRRGCFKRFTLFSLKLPWDGQAGYEWCHVRPAREWLALTLDLLPVAPTLIVAHSYGVNVVLEYLERNGLGALEGLVLMSSFYRTDAGGNDWRVFEGCLRGFRAILEQGIALRRGRELETGLMSVIVDKVVDHVGPVGFAECFSHFVRTPLLHLERLALPALVIAGERDPGATAAGNAALAAALPAGQITVLPRCGHFGMVEHPHLVEATVRQFLMQRLPALLVDRPVPSTRHTARERVNQWREE